jgi:hypothetical protein
VNNTPTIRGQSSDLQRHVRQSLETSPSRCARPRSRGAALRLAACRGLAVAKCWGGCHPSRRVGRTQCGRAPAGLRGLYQRPARCSPRADRGGPRKILRVFSVDTRRTPVGTGHSRIARPHKKKACTPLIRLGCRLFVLTVGGGQGIRTLDAVTDIVVFKTTALGHYASPPVPTHLCASPTLPMRAAGRQRDRVDPCNQLAQSAAASLGLTAGCRLIQRR